MKITISREKIVIGFNQELKRSCVFVQDTQTKDFICCTGDVFWQFATGVHNDGYNPSVKYIPVRVAVSVPKIPVAYTFIGPWTEDEVSAFNNKFPVKKEVKTFHTQITK